MKSKFIARVFMIICGLFLVACGTIETSVPEGYQGKTAIITDTYERNGSTKANLFYIETIDSKRIHNALSATQNASSGGGMRVQAAGAEREIEVKPLRVKLVGAVYSAAPIVALFNSGSNYRIEGEVIFKPQENVRYLVKGVLGEIKSAVWIEDINGNIASEIIGNMTQEEILSQDDKRGSKNREDIFANIQNGETPGLIIEKLGAPSEVFKDKKFMSNYVTRMRYIYSDLGTIFFTGVNEESLTVSKLVKNRKIILKDVETIKQELQDNSEQDLIRVAREHSRNLESRVDVLDLFIQKIWEERQSTNKYTVEAVSILCNVLGVSNNARYKAALETISAQASDKKLRRYAKKNSARINASATVTPFQFK